MASFRDTIEKIVDQEDESLDSDFSLDVDSAEEAIESLSIERQGDIIIVCQYGTKRGDIMRDPEVRFRIEDGEWVPISYRQDPSVRQYSADGIEIAEYLQTWARNLQSQGFLNE